MPHTRSPNVARLLADAPGVLAQMRSGTSARAIAIRYGVADGTVLSFYRRNGGTPPRPRGCRRCRSPAAQDRMLAAVVRRRCEVERAMADVVVPMARVRACAACGYEPDGPAARCPKCGASAWAVERRADPGAGRRIREREAAVRAVAFYAEDGATP